MCKTWYHQHCMDIPDVFDNETDVLWKCKSCATEWQLCILFYSGVATRTNSHHSCMYLFLCSLFLSLSLSLPFISLSLPPPSISFFLSPSLPLPFSFLFLSLPPSLPPSLPLSFTSLSIYLSSLFLSGPLILTFSLSLSVSFEYLLILYAVLFLFHTCVLPCIKHVD